MNRNVVAVAAVIILSACGSTPTGTARPGPSLTGTPPSATANPVATTAVTATPTPSASTLASASPNATSSAAASICVDTRGGDTGVAGFGAVKGTVPSGRILIGIEAAAGPSGTIALAWIESATLHVIPNVAEWTTAHPV